jgi:hypothetical protein
MICAGGLGLIMLACTPKYDWREVRNDELRWKAMFPAKPVEVSRSFTLPNANTAVTLTLQSAKIDNNLFAIGWIRNTTKSTTEHLESAMLANIAATPASIRRSTVQKHGLSMSELRASGTIRDTASKTDRPASLWMRTFTVTTPSAPGKPPAQHVIEVVVIGPMNELQTTDAELFIESFAPLK